MTLTVQATTGVQRGKRRRIGQQGGSQSGRVTDLTEE